MVRWIEYNTCLLSVTVGRQKCGETGTQVQNYHLLVVELEGTLLLFFSFVFCFYFLL